MDSDNIFREAFLASISLHPNNTRFDVVNIASTVQPSIFGTRIINFQKATSIYNILESFHMTKTKRTLALSSLE